MSNERTQWKRGGETSCCYLTIEMSLNEHLDVNILNLEEPGSV